MSRVNQRFSPSHLSDTILIKYWGGSGSNTGTKNFNVCSSVANLLFNKKYSWCKMISLSTSSTKIHIASEFPWTFSSHWKSGVMESSTLRVDLQRKTGSSWLKRSSTEWRNSRYQHQSDLQDLVGPNRTKVSTCYFQKEKLLGSLAFKTNTVSFFLNQIPVKTPDNKNDLWSKTW